MRKFLIIATAVLAILNLLEAILIWVGLFGISRLGSGLDCFTIAILFYSYSILFKDGDLL